MLASCLSGCGGGSGTAEVAPQIRTLQLNVKMASTSAADSWNVCLDANQNLVCDVDEPVATATADGGYQLTVPVETVLTNRYWVAEQSTPNSTAVLRLAAPNESPVISSLTTFVTAQLMNVPDAGLAAAQLEVARLLGLPSDTDLLADPGAASDGPTGAIASTAMTALKAGTIARVARVENVRAASTTETPTRPQLIPQVVLNVMARYADATSGSLLPTVTSRTITGETAEVLNPTQCAIAEPLRIRIDTDGAVPIVSKDAYVTARLRTDASATYGEALDLTTQIRCRGNST